jgi:hypothetical protein
LEQPAAWTRRVVAECAPWAAPLRGARAAPPLADRVFRKVGRGGHAWRKVDELRPADENPKFGTSVDVDGQFAIIGAEGDPLLHTPGVVYIFRRGQHWSEVARIASPLPAQDQGWGFGRTVGISGDSAIVGELDGTDSVAWILGRDVGGPHQWGVATRFPESGSLREMGNAPVAIDHHTAVFASGDVRPTAYVFERALAGAAAWGLEATYTTPLMPCCSAASAVAISGNYVVLGAPSVNGVHILARNQGGRDAWAVVSMLFDPVVVQGVHNGGLGSRVAISDDTVLIGSPGIINGDDPATVIVTSDVDGDGIRDDRDRCPRDPLNNVAGKCQRDSTQYPVLDDVIVQDAVTTATDRHRFTISAMFTNLSDVAVKNPFFEVTELSGPNVLINSDAGRGRVGATLSPDVGDGVLSPGESMAADFVIDLRNGKPFQFRVAFRGEPVTP